MPRPTDIATPPEHQLLLRRRDVAILLAVSQSQVEIWARSGVLAAIRLPDVRAVRYSRAQVLRLVSDLEATAGIESRPAA